MKTINVIIVRIYVMESSHLLNSVVNYLKTEANIRGISVFRAITGFGETGSHTSSLIDLSLDLPLIIEFFDRKEKIEATLEHLNKIIKHQHILYWDGKVND